MKEIIRWTGITFIASFLWGMVVWLAPTPIAWSIGLFLFASTVASGVITVTHINHWGQERDLW